MGIVLEVGCGAGIYTKYLRRHSQYLAALDIQRGLLIKSREGFTKKINNFFIQADAAALPFLDNSFNAVVCTQVLEHIKDDLKVLKEIKRVLKQNGRLIMSVPVPPEPVRANQAETPDAHCREGYYYAEIETLLKNLGFEIKNYKYHFFIFARFAFKLIDFFDRHLRIRPPGIIIFILCVMDVLFSLIVKIKPYGLTIEASLS